MAWELIERTPSGWKKYQTGSGVRYKRPTGEFASRHQWAGATASSDPETVEPEEPEEPPEIDYDIDIGDRPGRERGVIDRDDLGSYSRAEDWYREEYLTPIEEYQPPIDEMEFEVYDFDRYSYGVEYILVIDEGEDGETRSHSERHTTLLGEDEKEGLKIAFRWQLSDLQELADDYKDVLIKKTVVKKRDYHK